MPLYVSVPLPGPLRYGRRIGGGGPRRPLTPMGRVATVLLALGILTDVPFVPMLVISFVLLLAEQGWKRRGGPPPTR